MWHVLICDSICVFVFFSFTFSLCLGASWPAIHPMVAVWIPPVDRSKFMANTMASALGAAAAMPICGLLIEYINWQSTFYVTGMVQGFFNRNFIKTNIILNNLFLMEVLPSELKIQQTKNKPLCNKHSSLFIFLLNSTQNAFLHNLIHSNRYLITWNM